MLPNCRAESTHRRQLQPQSRARLSIIPQLFRNAACRVLAVERSDRLFQCDRHARWKNGRGTRAGSLNARRRATRASSNSRPPGSLADAANWRLLQIKYLQRFRPGIGAVPVTHESQEIWQRSNIRHTVSSRRTQSSPDDRDATTTQEAAEGSGSPVIIDGGGKYSIGRRPHWSHSGSD